MKNLAQIKNPVLPPSLGGEGMAEGGSAIGLLVGNIIGAFFVFAFILAFLYLIVGAFNWITSGGDKGKLQEARDRITNALIGLIVVGAIWAVMTLVSQFFGLDLTSLPIPAIER